MRTLRFWGLTVLTGVLLTLAWPARGLPFLMFFALVPLLYVEDQVSKERRKGLKFLGLSWAAFFIWNLLTTYWIYFSSPEGAYLAIGVNSLFMALVFWLFHRTKNVLGAQRGYVGLIVYWIAFEYLHLDWDLSWPWLMLGNSFASFPVFVQWYEFSGVLGGTFWILVSNILIYEIVKKFMDSRVRIRSYVFIALWLAVPMIISVIRYARYTENTDPVNIVLVQPNVDPWQKFNNISPQEQMDRMISLAGQKADSTTDYVICPETAIPVGVWDHEMIRNRQINSIREFISPFPRLRFITGMVHLQLFRPGDPIPLTAEPYGKTGNYFDDHNSAIQIDHGDTFQLYHKSKLVPGPEMFPFAGLLKPLQDNLFGNLGGMIGDYGTQKERSVFTNPDNHFKPAPVICYESIYGEFVGEYMLKGANFIAVSTNDAWWGNTPGHRQLLAYTRLRAIETRRSVARSANTGISCFINQRGDVIQATKFLETTVIAGTINANSKLSFYSRYGDFIGRISVFVSALLLLYAFVRNFLKKRNAL